MRVHSNTTDDGDKSENLYHSEIALTSTCNWFTHSLFKVWIYPTH